MSEWPKEDSKPFDNGHLKEYDIANQGMTLLLNQKDLNHQN